MKTFYSNLAFIFLIFSCSSTEDEPPMIKPLTISAIEESHTPIVAGQVVKLKASTAENLVNPQFSWKATLKGSELSFLDIKDETSTLFLDKGQGEYQIEVQLKDGERTGILKKSLAVGVPDFEYGAWGNSIDIIKDSENEHGYTIYPNLIGMPEPYQGAVNERLVYQRTSTKLIAYYFIDSKLKGGSYFKSGPSRNSNGDFIWYQLYYRSDQNDINKKFEMEGTEILKWNVSEERQNQYLNQSNGQGLSMAVDNGHLSVETTWKKNGVIAKLSLYRITSGTAIAYTIYKE